VYFSATGTTQKVVEAIARAAAAELGAPVLPYDFSLPLSRERFPRFASGDLAVFGVPVYAGRVPNLLVKQLAVIQGGGAAAVPVVLFGNRDFDDALVELRDILERRGFVPCAAGAFVGEHAFSTVLGKDRPDGADMAKVDAFSAAIVRLVRNAQSPANFAPLELEGTPYPYRGYYQPRSREGQPLDLRKVKPLTNENCTGCKLCAKLCTMGSINTDNVRDVSGVCIKCCACVKGCPSGAKYFGDENFLYHRRELEARYIRRAEPRCFIGGA
jgi:ferredoxin/flavodoxin